VPTIFMFGQADKMCSTVLK